MASGDHYLSGSMSCDGVCYLAVEMGWAHAKAIIQSKGHTHKKSLKHLLLAFVDYINLGFRVKPGPSTIIERTDQTQLDPDGSGKWQVSLQGKHPAPLVNFSPVCWEQVLACFD